MAYEACSDIWPGRRGEFSKDLEFDSEIVPCV